MAVLPESTASALGTELRALPIDQPELRGQIELAWRRDGALSPAARALVGLARERRAGGGPGESVEAVGG